MQYALYRAGNILMVSQVDDSILFGLKLNQWKGEKGRKFVIIANYLRKMLSTKNA